MKIRKGVTHSRLIREACTYYFHIGSSFMDAINFAMFGFVQYQQKSTALQHLADKIWLGILERNERGMLTHK